MQNIDSDLIRGNIDTIILKTMVDGDKYGLDIIKEVETRSNGTYELKQPTLYSCLKRLENQELISSYWLDSDIGGKRHYYKLTEKGKETLQKKQEEWSKSKFIIDNLLSTFNYDEYRLVKKDDYEKIIEGKQFEYSPAEPVSVIQNSESPLDESEISTPVEDSSITAESELSPSEEFDDSDENFEYHHTDEVQDNFKNEETQHDYSNEQPVDNSLDFAEPTDNNPQEFEVLGEYNNDTSLDSDDYEDEETDEEILKDIGISFDSIDEADDDLNVDYTSNEYHDNISYSNQEIHESPTQPDLEDETNQNQEKELNILSRLRSQDDEEINEYVGDKTSYLNHLNLNLVQDNLMDMVDDKNDTSINQKINEFSSAVEELNNFTSDGEISATQNDNVDLTVAQEFELEAHEQALEQAFEQENLIDDSFLSELDELNHQNNQTFFDSNEHLDYDSVIQNSDNNSSTDNFVSDFNSSNANSNENYQFEPSNDYEESEFEESENFEYNPEFMNTNSENYDSNLSDDTETIESTTVENANYSDFDSIISKNANDYKLENTNFSDAVYEPFRPNYTGENYKQKLSNLSIYSKVTLDENEKNNQDSSEATEKSKDISTLKAEFEKEGIAIKEFKRSHADDVERNYLLINKINMIRSLILLFGYVFILSALYIILNNTTLREIQGFSFKYFLLGFIPFIIYAGYYVILYLISPYKKVPAKYAPRIMLFISVIITVQLLLITYCVNLQLGFYSFTQSYYNHLIWIIPTVISFAPIISNLIYITLFYSKNFNV